MGVGMPQDMYLHEFGSQVIEVFGCHVYHVGSSLDLKTGWRDVDVRVILPDDEWKAWGFGEPGREHSDGKWVALCMAFSELGKRMTGLPIDFQIQQQTNANELFGRATGCHRSALGMVPLRMMKLPVIGASSDDGQGDSDSESRPVLPERGDA